MQKNLNSNFMLVLYGFLFSPLQIKKYSHLEDLLHISFCLVEDFFESLDIIFVFEDNWLLSPECTFEISTLLMHGMFVYRYILDLWKTCLFKFFWKTLN